MINYNSSQDNGTKSSYNVDHNYCSNSKFKKLKFVSLNVCFLCAKLKFPDFQNFVNQYDIICLTELRTDQYDDVNIDGFRFISASRAVAKRKSGGVGLFIKNNIWPFIKNLRQFE